MFSTSGKQNNNNNNKLATTNRAANYENPLNYEDEEENLKQLSGSNRSEGRGSLASGNNNQTILLDASKYDDEERRQFLENCNSNLSSSSSNSIKRKQLEKARLARQETIEEEEEAEEEMRRRRSRETGCLRMFFNFVKRKRIFIPLIIISLIAAIYCIPYVEIEPRIPARLPQIPFNFHDGPLRSSSASQFRFSKLYFNQIHGPESVALDSQGNMYLAIEGGFILYAHLNKSSPIKKEYYDGSSLTKQSFDSNGFPQPINPNLPLHYADIPELVKIAELNPIKQIPYYTANDNNNKRRARGGGHNEGGSWRRACQLDEKVYGSQLAALLDSSSSSSSSLSPPAGSEIPNEIDTGSGGSNSKKFVSNVVLSRCSKPLGIRLSADESSLYVVDTLSGLYQIKLKQAEKPPSNQRVVQRLVDFRANNRQGHQLLPVVHLDLPASIASAGDSNEIQRASMMMLSQNGFLNVSMKAVDDLVVDQGSGTRGGDMIYMTLASQNWQALSFIYDMLEGRPSGVILRFDTGANQLSVLDPARVAHVRTSNLEISNVSSRLYTATDISTDEPYMGVGAPRLDENDVFDDRPLHFPNGLELTDDRQAILIADTTNKRIIKHYIKGSRKGTSDLWAWTPNHPDNIRRGYDKNQETYWVVGCGQDTTNQFDALAWLNNYPRLRKYILKNIYLLGWLIEMFGAHVMSSTSVRDFGYSLKLGDSISQSFCPGLMILQYNKYGDIIRSIYSKEFPNDLSYYSQVSEVIDAKNQEHILYLGSPSYKYLTKLVLPTDSFDLPTTTTTTNINSI